MKAKRFLPVLVAIGVVSLALLLRMYLLDVLGTRIFWVTFYPAVMVVAVWQGFWAGSLATLLTCTVALWVWPSLRDEMPIKDSADMLGMAVFSANCLLMSGVAEAMRRARAQAREACAQAEKANLAKSVFLAHISHELRTPLNAILGFAQLLRKDPTLGSDQTAQLETISHSGEHLLHLINNIIDLSRIESGRIDLDPIRTDLNAVFEEALTMVRWKTDAKGIRLTLERAPELPRWVRIDVGKLRQILLNLLGNAAKFTERGTIVLRVTLAANAAGKDPLRLQIEVLDSGPGISPEVQTRLFQPFVQGSAQTASESGSGLGLAISRQIARAMGGRIDVDSQVGKGSRFSVELPLEVLVEQNGDAALASNETRLLKLAPDTPRHRILVVEDDAVNRQLLRDILLPFDFELRAADNGQEALDQFDSWQPELIWMDIRMPVMDGVEATRRIRARPDGAAVKIVALTAHALEEERRQICAVGCQQVLGKPYQVSEILGALTQHLGVRFVVDEQATPRAIGVNAAELAGLPKPLLNPLADAVGLLEAQACLAAIDAIHSADPNLALRLRQMIRDYRFRELWESAEQALLLANKQ